MYIPQLWKCRFLELWIKAKSFRQKFCCGCGIGMGAMEWFSDIFTVGVKSAALAKLQIRSDTASPWPPLQYRKTSYLLSVVKEGKWPPRGSDSWGSTASPGLQTLIWGHTFSKTVKMEFLSKVLFCYFLLPSAGQRIYLGLWLKKQLKVIICSGCWADCGQGWSSLPMTMNGSLGCAKMWLF